MNLIPLRNAVYCVNCKQISDDRESRYRCIGCNSVAILYVAGLMKTAKDERDQDNNSMPLKTS